MTATSEVFLTDAILGDFLTDAALGVFLTGATLGVFLTGVFLIGAAVEVFLASLLVLKQQLTTIKWHETARNQEYVCRQTNSDGNMTELLTFSKRTLPLPEIYLEP